MPELTPQLIKLTLEECHLAFNDTGERAHGYEWVLEELCRIALKDRDETWVDFDMLSAAHAKLVERVEFLLEERVLIDKMHRAESAKLIEEVEDWKANYNKATDACVALRAENERLREALERVASGQTNGQPCTFARAALQSKQGE